MRAFLIDAVVTFNFWVLIYFLSLNGIYLVLFVVSLYEVLKFIKRTFFSDYQQILQSDMTWPISILVPAHNEEKTIAETVRSLQMVNYGEFEIIVINDGSNDFTLARLTEMAHNHPDASIRQRLAIVLGMRVPHEPVVA